MTQRLGEGGWAEVLGCYKMWALYPQEEQSPKDSSCVLQVRKMVPDLVG